MLLNSAQGEYMTVRSTQDTNKIYVVRRWGGSTSYCTLKSPVVKQIIYSFLLMPIVKCRAF